MLALCILSCFLFCASIPRESNSNTDNFPHSHGCVSMLLLRHQSHLCYRPCQYNALNSQYLDLQSSGSSRSLLAILNISVWSCGLMHRKCVALSSVSVCRELLTCLTKKEKKKISGESQHGWRDVGRGWRPQALGFVCLLSGAIR